MDVALVIRMGHDPVKDWKQVRNYVVEGERLGATMVWSSEAWVQDCVSPLGYFAAITDKMRLGTGIMQAGTRTPALVAMTALTLQHMSDDRFVLGLGTSGPQVIEGWHGIPFKQPLGRMREIIEIVRMATRGERVLYNGKHYHLPFTLDGEGKALRTPMEPRHVPIYMGSLGPVALKMVGELADGWICPQFMPETRDMFFDSIAEGAKISGRDVADLDVQVNVNFEITDDVSEAVAVRKAGYAFSIGAMGSEKTNFYVQAYRRAGFGDAVDEVKSLYRERKRREAAEAVPDNLVLNQNLIGTRDWIKQRVRLYRDAGVKSFRLMPHGNTQDEWYDIDRVGQFCDLVREVNAENA